MFGVTKKIIAMGFLLLAIVAGLLWVRSARSDDIIQYSSRRAQIQLISSRGELEFSVYLFDAPLLGPSEYGWSYSFDDDLSDTFQPTPTGFKLVAEDIHFGGRLYVVGAPYSVFFLPLLIILALRLHAMLKHKRDASKCPACGYDLQGNLAAKRCPECGSTLLTTVRCLADPEYKRELTGTTP